MANISKSGIAPNLQIKSEHLIRIIDAISGESPDTEINISGSVTASYFIGDGSQLTNLTINELSNQKTITSSVLLDNTYNNTLVKVKTSSSITIPNGLINNFNCIFDVWDSGSVNFVVSGGSSINSTNGTNLLSNKVASLYQDESTNIYRLKGELSWY